MTKSLRDLENIIKYNFKDKKLLHRALTHKSYNNIENNEKLEFLGDRVLGLVISKKLLDKFPDEKEGIIDKKFASLVNKNTCVDIAKQMNLKKYLYLGASHKNLERFTDKIFSDTLEAIVGAIYLDGGYDKTKKVLQKHIFKKYLDFKTLLQEEIDFKSKLYIWCQRKKLRLNFKLISEHHENGQWEYVILTQINNQDYGQGKGQSKKVAEQHASKETFELLGEL